MINPEPTFRRPRVLLLVTGVLLTLAIIARLVSLTGTQMPHAGQIGYPTMFSIFVFFWMLWLPVILIEAFVAVKTLEIKYLKALWMAGLANIFSKPIMFVVGFFLILLEMLVCGGMPIWKIDTLWKQALAAIIQSPWLPYENPPIWMLVLATIWVSIPLFLLSIWVEYAVAKHYTHEKYTDKLLFKWACIANCITAGLMLFTVSAVLLTFYFIPPK